MLVDADKGVLCQLLHRNSHEVELMQTACQRYIDEHEDFEEARSLLQLVQKESRTEIDDRSATNDDNLATKRKRRK